MKTLIFTLFASIFLSLNICEAQNTQGKLSISKFSENQIPFAEIKRIAEDTTGKITYIDSEGNELRIIEYGLLVLTEDENKQYFEIAKTDKLTKTIRKRFSEAKRGDKIVLVNLKCMKPKGATALLTRKDFVIID
ncbi:MAG: hypothetical protein ACXWDO_08165 [Bacteroidia bacterium]